MDNPSRPGACFVQGGVHIIHRMASLAEEYPDYCFAKEASNILRVTKRTLDRCHAHKIERITVDGVTLYHRASVKAYAHNREHGKGGPTVLRLIGIDVERMRTIAETYYRQNLDTAPPHLLKLAKKVARL